MANIVIKKKVSFDFLGSEYKEGYLILKSIPLRDFDEFLVKAEEIKEDGRESIKFMLAKLEELFLEGKWPNDKGELEDINKEDLGDLDGETLNKIFGR